MVKGHESSASLILMRRLLIILSLMLVPVVAKAQTIVTPVNGTATIDASTCAGGAMGLACSFKIVLTANTTVSIINSRGGQELGIFFLENNVGGWTVTWSSTVPSNPTVSTTVNASTF